MLNLKKIVKYLIKNPSQLLTNFLSDIKKDKTNKKLIYNKVWCIGLPKSGTTLIESILEELPYVEMFTSILRKWENTNPKYMCILPLWFWMCFRNRIDNCFKICSR